MSPARWLRSAVFLFALAAVMSAPAVGVVAAVPDFQLLDADGTLAVTNPTQLLSIPVRIELDASLPPAAVRTVSWNGLARDPTSGKIYIAGSDNVTSKSYLALVDFTTGKETTIGALTGESIVDLAFDGAGHLYALTDNLMGADHHALLLVNPGTAAFSVAKSLDSHGGGDTVNWFGAIAYNPADGYLYYASNDSVGNLFVDKLAPGTFTQTPVITTNPVANDSPTSMVFTEGKLWIAAEFLFLSADATNIGAGLTVQSQNLQYPSILGPFVFSAFGMIAAELSCLPSATTACIGNRFKVEVGYDATPTNGSGPASVVLESAASVKFTFFDAGNIEMIVKLLDACVPPFNKWWVFAGGLTNVGVTIKVTDTANGAVKNYASAKGQIFQAFADTEAFACP